MDFDELLGKAKAGDAQAVSMLLDMYRPLLMKFSIVNGNLDEDLFQEQCLMLLRSIALYKL